MARDRSNSMFEDLKYNSNNQKIDFRKGQSFCEVLHESDDSNEFKQELEKIRSCIKTQFRNLRDLIKSKEEKMLQSINEAQTKYYKYSKHRTLEEINELKTVINNIARDNTLRSQLMSGIQENMERVTAENAEICISFNWPSSIRTSIEQLDETLRITKHAGSKGDDEPDSLDISNANNTIYRISPNFSFGATGDNPNELISPRDVTVEVNSGNILCTDWEGNAIFVFSRFGELLRKITEVKNPYGICCTADKIFVTEASNSLIKLGKVGNHACIKLLSFNGEIIARTGKWGTSNGNLKNPSGLAYDSMKDELFVSDTENNRIQLFQGENLKFLSVFNSQCLKQPYDVKLHNNEVYVIDAGNPCLHKFNRKGVAISHTISRGPQLDLGLSYFFVVDKSGCTILTDHDNHQLKVFTPNGQLARVIGKEGNRAGEFYVPLGISHIKENEIVVLSLKQSGTIQMFNINLSIF